jgi:exonuclease SbcD
MVHGTVSGTGVDAQLLRWVEYGGAHLDRSALREDAFDYVALGHYHNATRIASNVWYAGATERTATNIWAEADTRKGWVLFDVETRTGEFREVQTREVVDLPRFSARRGPGVGDGASGNGASGDDWLSAEEIDARIRESVAALPDGVAGKVVRLVITDVPRDLFRELDHRQIRSLKAEALHFHLDARRPEVRRRAVREDVRRRTLEEELEIFLEDWEPASPGIDRDRLLELGAAYLAATEDWRDELELDLEGPDRAAPSDREEPDPSDPYPEADVGDSGEVGR